MEYHVIKIMRPFWRTPWRHGTLLRSLVYASTERELAGRGVEVHCRSVDRPALEHWRQGWRPAFRDGAPAAHWEWARLVGELRPDPYRFEIAVWGRRPGTTLGEAPRGWELCGLAVGRLSNRRRIVRVSHVAASPRRDHPLKGHVLEAVAVAAEAYGSVWRADEVRFEDPLPGTHDVYARLGYDLATPAARTAYWGTRL